MSIVTALTPGHDAGPSPNNNDRSYSGHSQRNTTKPLFSYIIFPSTLTPIHTYPHPSHDTTPTTTKMQTNRPRLSASFYASCFGIHVYLLLLVALLDILYRQSAELDCAALDCQKEIVGQATLYGCKGGIAAKDLDAINIFLLISYIVGLITLVYSEWMFYWGSVRAQERGVHRAARRVDITDLDLEMDYAGDMPSASCATLAEMPIA